MKIQPRIKGKHRLPSYSSLLPAIRKAIDSEAKHFNVSRSFVISTALADALGIDEGERYYNAGRKGKGRRKN